MNKPGSLLHRIKDWIEGFAQKPYSSVALFLFAFIEAFLLPIAPDLLLIPLSVMRPRRSLFYAAICVTGSTCGAVLGYFTGFQVFEAFGARVLGFFGWTDLFEVVLGKYHDNAWTTLLFAGFTPIPFQVFTLAAGFRHTIDFGTFALATIAGRSLRFFFLGILLFLFGPAVKASLDKYLERILVGIGVFIVIWILCTRFLF